MGILLGVALASAVGLLLGRCGVSVGKFSPLSVIRDYDMSLCLSANWRCADCCQPGNNPDLYAHC